MIRENSQILRLNEKFDKLFRQVCFIYGDLFLHAKCMRMIGRMVKTMKDNCGEITFTKTKYISDSFSV